MSHAMFVRYFHTLFSYDGRVLCSHVFFRTLCSHKKIARYFRPRSLHALSARYFRMIYPHAIFVHGFRSLSSHAIFARYFCTLFPHAIFAFHFRTLFSHAIFIHLFAHVIFARCFRTLCSHATSARFFRMLFESFLSPSETDFGGHFGVILGPVLGHPGGSQKTFKIDPKMDRILGPKILVSHLF